MEFTDEEIASLANAIFQVFKNFPSSGQGHFSGIQGLSKHWPMPFSMHSWIYLVLANSIFQLFKDFPITR